MENPESSSATPFIDWGNLARDFRFSMASLLRAKGFSLTAVFTLALGMFLTLTVWLYAAWTISSNAPYPHPEEVFSLGFTMGKSTDFVPYQIAPQLQAYKEQLDVFSEIAAVSNQPCNVVLDNEPVGSNVFRTVEGSFKMLGIVPRLGRDFLPGEHKPGEDNVVIISDRFWKDHFRSDPEVLGQMITVDERACRIVGVLGKTQQLPIFFYTDVYRPWVPVIDPAKPFEWAMVPLVRLRPGVSLAQATAALQQAKVSLSPQFAKWLDAETTVLRRPNQTYRPEIYRMLFGAALFLFAIACLNTVNLMLIRVLGRNREFSIRRAIGGAQSQVVRLIVMEATIIAFAAGVLVYGCIGLFAPYVLTLWTGFGEYYPLWADGPMIQCLLVLVAIATILLGATGVWHLRHSDINAGLKDGGLSAGEGRGTARGRALLVMLQAAFAVVLLAGAGLMIRTFQNTARVDLGINPNGKVNVVVAYPTGADPSNESRLQTFAELEEIFRHLPGVRAAGSGSGLNFWGWSGVGEPSLRLADGTMIGFNVCFMSGNFPEASGLHLVKGRWMSQVKGAQEICINESLAKKRFGKDDPIGQILSIRNGDKDAPLTVTGVVHDVRAGVRVQATDVVYEISQWWPPGTSTIMLRYDEDPGAGNESLIRRAIYRANPHLITLMVQPLNDQLKQSLSLERQALNILRWLSAVAVTLATVGLFSVLAYTVDRRRPEFGVRLALGAPPGNILWLVLRSALVTAGIGVIVGSAAALALTQLMTSLLYETQPFEPVVYFTVAAVLMISAFFAGWIPARRAAQVDVARLLRRE